MNASRTALVAALVALAACRCSDDPPLEATFRGCAAVNAERQCRVPDGGASLTLWVPAPCEVVEVDNAVRTPVDRGCRLVFERVDDDVTVRAGGRRFHLEVVDATEATEAHDKSRRARTLLHDGAWPAAVALLDEAASAHAAAGRSSDAVLDLQAAAFALAVSMHRLGDARERLDRAEPLLAVFPEGASTQPYYRGLVALAGGDPIHARQRFVEAWRASHRLGLDRLARGIRAQEAIALRLAGHSEEAREVVRTLAESAGDAAPCDRARLIENLTWVELLDAEAANERPFAKTIARLDEARRINDDAKCGHLTDRGNLALERTLAALLAEDVEGARTALAASSTTSDDPSLRYWRAELSGRLAWLEGDPERARDALTDAAREARTSLHFAAVWRAEVWSARIALAEGDAVAAGRAFANAEAALDDEVARISVDQGGAQLLQERRQSALGLAAYHLRNGSIAAALCTLRRADSRRLARLARHHQIATLPTDKRERWYAALETFGREREALDELERSVRDASVAERRAAEVERSAIEGRVRAAVRTALDVLPTAPRPDCSAPPHDTMYLAVYQDWVFGADSEGVEVQDAPLDLSKFDAMLARNDSVRLLGDARDVHLATWRDAPLANRRAVVYALDLGPTDRAPRGRAAFVVADAGENLEGARTESRAVERTLAARGWTVEAARGREATTRRLLEALASVDLLHFAGHALPGRDAADRLELADGSFAIADVLLAARVPRTVVLSGCRTSGDADGLNLAQAFLLAGASQVAASPTDLTDRIEGVAALYDAEPEHLELAKTAQKRAPTPLTVWVR